MHFLSAPEAYADRPREVVVKETHMSWVFLAGERVYKLKKPVHYPFLDFRTLKARETNCQEEVRLNRRLAPDVYLGVVPLTEESDGGLALAGRGRTVDWLVAMRRLPEERLLDRAIAAGTVERRQIAAVADLLCGFYAKAAEAGFTPAGYVAQFAREQAVTEKVLLDPRFDLDHEQLDRVFGLIWRGLREDRALLEARVREGRIVEGHGDLRPEHVCLTEPPVVIDCLEFSRALRLVDPFDEIAFLALECHLLRAGWIGDELMRRCAEAFGDGPPPRLVAFYWAYRACLRARLVLSHLYDPEPREPEKWRPLARRYLDLAEAPAITQDLPAGP